MEPVKATEDRKVGIFTGRICILSGRVLLATLNTARQGLGVYIAKQCIDPIHVGLKPGVVIPELLIQHHNGCSSLNVVGKMEMVIVVAPISEIFKLTATIIGCDRDNTLPLGYQDISMQNRWQGVVLDAHSYTILFCCLFCVKREKASFSFERHNPTNSSSLRILLATKQIDAYFARD